MKVFTEIIPLKAFLKNDREKGHTLGFVPTMGALHEGHLSLVRQAVMGNDLSIASIFVNPKQFNNPDDLKHYPRTLDQDIRLLGSAGCDIVFAPPVNEMYPEPVSREFDFGQLDKVMEGRYRPGHFNGVAIVVQRLFEIIRPDRAYFGLKDFQQLVIIRELVRMTAIPVEIIACPIVREPDGLAMSSRNMRLNPSERAVAPGIYKTLMLAREKFGQSSLNEIKALVNEKINSFPGMRLEYFEIVDQDTLTPVASPEECRNCIACIAVYLGDVRLIDNMILN